MTTSINDTTILAVLSRYPDMPAEEANEYISNIENEENVPVCEAVIGRVSKDTLDDDARQTFDEFQRWSLDRTRRVHNEQIFARLRKKETRTSLALNRLHQKGIIPDSMLLMYGISGEMPEMGNYMQLSTEEKNALWRERMERRFGPNWIERFEDRNISLPLVLERQNERRVVNWKKEGF